MNKTKFSLFCFALILNLFLTPNFVSAQYQEVITQQGKVITGIEKNEALEKFGAPTTALNEFWYYENPDSFFVYFPSQEILNIHLYPEFCDVPPDFPLEVKAFADTSDFKIVDITSQVKLTVNEPEKFIFDKPGTIIPKKSGEYQILASYKNIFSNTAYLKVRVPPKEPKEEEKILSINILPYKPTVFVLNSLPFIALGTFFNQKENNYIIRDISDQVAWFTQQDGRITTEPNKNIYFSSPGKVKVFAKVKDFLSYSQEVEVKKDSYVVNRKLKHITLLPEFMITPKENPIALRTWGTYGDNRVRDITSEVNWEIGDKEVLAFQGKDKFLSKSKGQTEVSAELDKIESSSVKIVVLDKEKNKLDFSKEEKEDDKEEKKYNKESFSRDLTKNIKNEIEKIKENLKKEEKKLTYIRIIPDKLKIPLGKNDKLVARGVFSDDSQEDLTILGEWISSNSKVATVSSGKVLGVDSGEVKIYVKFLGIESTPASVIIEGPQLVSIILSPQTIETSMKEKFKIKAEGYFSDNTYKDITSLVNWEIINSRIIKIQNGMIMPLRFGETKVNAEYSGIKSLPANIKVIFTLLWLLEKILVIIFFLILIIALVFFILYIITERNKHKLMSLYKNPREFIIALYENLMAIFIIFGAKHQVAIIPLSYAELIEKKYSMKNKLFLRFTERFEEAKYSKHIFELEGSNLTMHNYNNVLDMLTSNYNKFSLFFIYCLSLLYRRPLFISGGLRLDDKK